MGADLGFPDTDFPGTAEGTRSSPVSGAGLAQRLPRGLSSIPPGGGVLTVGGTQSHQRGQGAANPL